VEKGKEEAERMPLPEVNFNSLIFSLSSSALLHLGEIADPHTGQKTKDLPLAKHSIDIIAMLKDKTKGNLSGEEQKFVESILTDLRLRYVKLPAETEGSRQCGSPGQVPSALSARIPDAYEGLSNQEAPAKLKASD
jgi:hypothetical protein